MNYRKDLPELSVRLRKTMWERGHHAPDVGALIGVQPQCVWRWAVGNLPHPGSLYHQALMRYLDGGTDSGHVSEQPKIEQK